MSSQLKRSKLCNFGQIVLSSNNCCTAKEQDGIHGSLSLYCYSILTLLLSLSRNPSLSQQQQQQLLFASGWGNVFTHSQLTDTDELILYKLTTIETIPLILGFTFIYTFKVKPLKTMVTLYHDCIIEFR